VIGNSVNFGNFPPAKTNHFYPMKGPMVTQTFQDIIGHEPFHWRGDRAGLEQFDATFTNLQAAASGLTTNEMNEFRDFLATVRFAPNPYREFDNSLSTNVPLTGQVALGRGALTAGAHCHEAMPRRDKLLFAQAQRTAASCAIPSQPDWEQISVQRFSVDADSARQQFRPPYSVNRTGSLLATAFQSSFLRNMFDKLGMDLTQTKSRSGFGFSHDGSVDSLVASSRTASALRTTRRQPI